MKARFTNLQSAAELRRAHREVAALFRRAGARPGRARLQEGLLPTLILSSHELWLTQHTLANRYRNALGPGDPTERGLVWPSVQLNVALTPGSARPHARFLRDRTGALWLAHSGTLGGRQVGISRAGFLAFMARTGLRAEIAIDEREEQVLLLGTFARPAPLLDAISELVHAAHAYRGSLAAGLRER
ncbi:MAG TPA: hypothetical protein VM261_14845 [Kofleriaceae bacterium]|nr:hypothetical protein [Kofleriaceae bacterium]